MNGYLSGWGPDYYAEAIRLGAVVWGENQVVGIPNGIADGRVELQIIPDAANAIFSVFFPL
jgi:hypothetical protein